MSIFNTPKYDPLGSRNQAGADNLNLMSGGIDSRTIRPGVGTMIQHTSGGTVVSVKKQRRAAATSECLLGGYSNDPDTEGNVIITPGWLHAPNKSELIEPSSRTPVAGETVWIKCPWTATLNSDGVLEAGGELGAPVVEQGATMPSNTVPHVASLTGIYYVPLGAWDADLIWIKQGCGAIHVDFCPRVFSLTRGVAA